MAQSQQVAIELTMVFDIPYIGPINRIEKITFGPNMRHSIENSKAERFYARLFVNKSKGKIIDINSHNFWKYDIEDKEYWVVPFEKALYKQDTTETKKEDSGKKRSSWSTTIGDDDNPLEGVSRVENYDVILLGKQSKKWVTTFTSANGSRLVLEEWSVPELPQLRLADSLNRALELELGRPDSVITPLGRGFSNMMLTIENIPHELEPIPGEIIKAVIKSYGDDDEPNFSMKLEITKLISEALELRHFLVPNNYKKVTK
ncbi:MAG TPA: hypothetical protein EYI98_07465 [Candidatus Marinimicrobia bacterium]|nr:hypothetical protein [Candidatus Neomarinimicrobiota bacterium]